MRLNFTKMEGLGNDYVYVNCLRETVEKPSELAVAVSDRHFGIGSDGLILIRPSVSGNADFTMDMYNADGSRSEMCGNGIRCVGKYVYDYGLTDKTEIAVDTLAGIKYLKLMVERTSADDRGKVKSVTVNMGAPIFLPSEIPVTAHGAGETVRDYPVLVSDREFRVTCVSMGNPHCVAFVDNVENFPLERYGALLEGHEMFPNRVNAEFVRVVNRGYVEMRVWERGTGETLACGTGACATVAACIVNGLTDDEVTVKLLGGALVIRWDREENLIYMTGPARVVFDGTMDV